MLNYLTAIYFALMLWADEVITEFTLTIVQELISGWSK